MRAAALRRTVDKIEKNVEGLCVFDMADWAYPVGKDGTEFYPGWDEGKPCGTAGCFAGWAVSERVRKDWINNRGVDIVAEAERVLGLTRDESSLLFDTGNWPTKFRVDYYAAGARADQFDLGTRQRIAAEKKKVKALRGRVEHFIKTQGKE